MSQLKICRICLRTEAKMFKMNVYGLQWYYEEVLDFKVDINDRLPQYFCFECAALLHKFHNFKEKCSMGQKILNDMDMEGAITYESIYKLDRKQLKLISLLDYMIPNTKADTVFTVKSVSMDKTVINGKRDKIVIPQESDCEVENYKKDLDVLAEQEIMCDIEIIKAEKTDDVPFYTEKGSTDGYNYNIEYNYDDDIHDNSSVDSKPSASKNLTGIFIVDKNEDVTAKKLRPRRIKQPKKESVKNIKTEKTDKNKSVSLRHLRARRPKPPKKIKVAVKIPEILNSGNWKKTTWSEEEAMRTFNAKSLEEKYISATYKCTDCFIPFSNNEIYTRHRQKWHTEQNYRFECKFCKRRFRRHHQLKKHIKSHYERYQCLRCDLVCPLESTVMIHDASHSGAIYKCEVCHQEYKHTSTYYSHMRTAHKHKHLCNLCGRSFVNEIGLNQHKKRTHFINDKGEPLGVNKDSPDVEEVVNTYCSTCDIKFETEDAYHEHKLHSSKHSDGMATRECKPRRRKPMDCPKCGESFKSQAACWKHCRKEHPNDKLIPTMLCETKSICEICGVSVSSNNLRLHMMNRHEKKYECYCNICGKRFSMKASLKIHSVVHTGEKPFKCSLCDKSFTQKGSMNLHYRTYHLKEPYPKRNRNTIGSLRNDPGDFYPIP